MGFPRSIRIGGRSARPCACLLACLLACGLAWGLTGPAALAATSGDAAPARELVREPFTLDHLSSDWEVLLHDPDGVFPSAGSLRVAPAPAADWDAFSRLRNLVRYRLPLVGARIEARVSVALAIDAVGHGASLALYQDDRNWVELAYRGESEDGELVRMLRLSRSVGGERASVARRQGRGPARARETLVLVLERQGDVFEARVEVPMGPPGVVRRGLVGRVEAPGLGDLQLVLKALRSVPPPRGLDSDRVHFDDVVAVGLSADARLGEAPETLRVAYATDFRDPAAFHREFSVLRPEPGNLVVEDGLELVAGYGIPGDRWTPIRNLVLANRPLPAGSWGVEVEVDAGFTSPHDDVGVVLYGENGNALYLGHWALPGKSRRQAYLRTVEGERGATRFSSDPAAGTGVEPTTLVFRVERDEKGYTGWVDVAGRGWVKVGEADLTLVEPRIGLFARSARDLGSVPGAGVRFARLWVMTEGR